MANTASTEILEEFGLSRERGFLINPAESLPAAYAAWEELAASLTDFLSVGQVRAAVATLPVLDTAELGDGEAVLYRAKHLLTVITQAYVFGSKSTATSLPPQIAVPLCAISEKLKVPPLLSYMDYVLTNWTLIDPEAPFSLSNIKIRTGINGGIDEAWFILVHVAVEQGAGTIIDDCVAARLAAEAGELEELTTILNRLAEATLQLRKTFLRMRETCDPHVYFLRVRPFTHGWHNNPAFDGGMIYEGVDAFEGKPQSYRGETGAQSSVVPTIDGLLAVQHPNDQLNEHLKQMRDYMPARHRDFLAWIEASPLRAWIERLGAAESISDAESGLLDAYNACCEALTEFRTSHLKIAHDYVYAHRNTAIDSTANPASVGTGGTPPIDYLRHHRDYTDVSAVKRKS